MSGTSAGSSRRCWCAGFATPGARGSRHAARFAPDACGRIEWGGQPIKYLGQIDPTVRRRQNLAPSHAGGDGDGAGAVAGRASASAATSATAEFSRRAPRPVADCRRCCSEIKRCCAGSICRFLRGSSCDDYSGKPLEAGSKRHHHAGLPQSHRHADQRAGRAVRAESRGGRQKTQPARRLEVE